MTDPQTPAKDWHDRDAEAFGRAHRQGIANDPQTPATEAGRRGGDRRAAEEAEAQSYAEAIYNGWPVEWAQWNQRIIDRWSKAALLRIKRRAWDIVERGR